MSRNGVREQVEASAESTLARGEQVGAGAPVWATESRGRVPLLFRGRGIYYVVVTDRRLLLFRLPRWSRRVTADHLVLAKPLHVFTVERVRTRPPLLQLRVRAPGDRLLVFEFRPRDRRAGRQIAELLSRERPEPAAPA